MRAWTFGRWSRCGIGRRLGVFCSSLTPIISIPVGRAMCILNVCASHRKLGLVISKTIVVVCSSMHYRALALSVLLSKLSSISHAGRSRSVESIPLNEYVFVRHRRTLHINAPVFADNSVVTQAVDLVKRRMGAGGCYAIHRAWRATRFRQDLTDDFVDGVARDLALVTYEPIFE